MLYAGVNFDEIKLLKFIDDFPINENKFVSTILYVNKTENQSLTIFEKIEWDPLNISDYNRTTLTFQNQEEGIQYYKMIRAQLFEQANWTITLDHNLHHLSVFWEWL